MNQRGARIFFIFSFSISSTQSLVGATRPSSSSRAQPLSQVQFTDSGPNEVLKLLLPGGRSRSRPAKTWLKSVEKDIKFYGLKMLTNSIELSGGGALANSSISQLLEHPQQYNLINYRRIISMYIVGDFMYIVKAFFEYSGCILCILWGYFVYIAGVFCVYCGDILCILWGYFVYIVGVFYVYCGGILCILWGYFMYIVRVFCVYCGGILCILWGFFVYIVGLFWVYCV